MIIRPPFVFSRDSQLYLRTRLISEGRGKLSLITVLTAVLYRGLALSRLPALLGCASEWKAGVEVAETARLKVSLQLKKFSVGPGGPVIDLLGIINLFLAKKNAFRVKNDKGG